MKKTIEDYFLEGDFLDESRGDLTSAEKSFLKRYMGLDEEKEKEVEEDKKAGKQAPEVQPGSAKARPEPVQGPPKSSEEQEESSEQGVSETAEDSGEAGPPPGEIFEAEDPGEPEEAEPSLEDRLKTEPEVQLVAFTVKGQEYTVPIVAVQEVIRFKEPTKLPAAPSFLAGIINLRGRVTPLVRLYELLGVPGDDGENRFIVVCKRKGLQFGLMIEKMKTMYHVPQENIDWGVETHLGVTVDYVSGLLKAEQGLVGILSVDRVVEKVLSG